MLVQVLSYDPDYFRDGILVFGYSEVYLATDPAVLVSYTDGVTQWKKPVSTQLPTDIASYASTDELLGITLNSTLSITSPMAKEADWPEVMAFDLSTNLPMVDIFGGVVEDQKLISNLGAKTLSYTATEGIIEEQSRTGSFVERTAADQSAAASSSASANIQVSLSKNSIFSRSMSIPANNADSRYVATSPTYQALFNIKDDYSAADDTFFEGTVTDLIDPVILGFSITFGDSAGTRDIAEIIERRPATVALDVWNGTDWTAVETFSLTNSDFPSTSLDTAVCDVVFRDVFRLASTLKFPTAEFKFRVTLGTIPVSGVSTVRHIELHMLEQGEYDAI